ncbi:hypothetical protein J2749_001844 [Methanobacterium oryzae]
MKAEVPLASGSDSKNFQTKGYVESPATGKANPIV